MNSLHDIIYAVFAVCLIIGAIFYYKSAMKNIRLTEEKAHFEIQLRNEREERQNLEAALEKQNAAMEAMRLATVKVADEIALVTKTYTVKRTEVVEKLEKDSSCENRMSIIDDVMRVYHGLRPEDRDKARNYVP